MKKVLSLLAVVLFLFSMDVNSQEPKQKKKTKATIEASTTTDKTPAKSEDKKACGSEKKAGCCSKK
ncbi:hypothetical protein [Flavobacterium sp.]